jgi:glyoxylase-like metal-dependent hydrolase (beta-lactamase superfamily II)
MIQRLYLGTTRLALALDAHTTIDGNEVFYPAPQEEWGSGLDPAPDGQIPIVVNSLLITEGNTHTLVDTGFGEEQHPDRPVNLLSSLAHMDVQPKDIDRVILTHAHGDHCMGNTLQREGRWLPAFPLAEYVIQEMEVSRLRDAGDLLWATRFAPLAQRGKLRLISGKIEVDNGIICWPTPGHTRGHQSVLIRRGYQQALYMGDLAILAKNMEYTEYGPSWAWSREEDARSRARIARWAADTQAVLIIGHDPRHRWVRLQEAGSHYRVFPLEG